MGVASVDPPAAASVHALHHAARQRPLTAAVELVGVRLPTLCELLVARATRASRPPRSSGARRPACSPTAASCTPRWSSTRSAGSACSPTRTTSRPTRPISRGLEVHPAWDGSGDELHCWIERDLVRHGYGWHVRRARRSASAWAPTTRASTSRRARSPWPSARAATPCASRATGFRTGCAPRPTARRSSPATAPGTASRCRARGSGPPSTSASPAGASCAACSTASAPPPTRGRATPPSAQATLPPTPVRCACSG
jgi:hypothetical protein